MRSRFALLVSGQQIYQPPPPQLDRLIAFSSGVRENGNSQKQLPSAKPERSSALWRRAHRRCAPIPFRNASIAFVVRIILIEKPKRATQKREQFRLVMIGLGADLN